MSSTVWQHLPPMGGSGTTARVTMRWAAASDVGRVRSVNEDSVLADPPVFVVADGMGGHEAGDVASALAVKHFSHLVESPPVRPEEVSDLLGTANSEILLAGVSQEEDRAMGTTAVGLVLIDGPSGPNWMVFNIGDSRIYRCMEGAVEQLSVDHSYVQELVEAGRITEPAARTHPQRNVVTRALGVEAEAQADLWLRSPVPGERFVLCSDGLSGEVAPEALNAVVSQPRSPEETARTLVDMAIAAGGKDNISVIVLDVECVDGVAHDDHVTAPRDEQTREHRMNVRVGEVVADGGRLDGDGGLSETSPEGSRMIHVPEDLAAGVVPDLRGPVETAAGSLSPDSMIAGVPEDMPESYGPDDKPVFDPPKGLGDTPAAPTSVEGVEPGGPADGLSDVDQDDVDEDEEIGDDD